MTTNPKLIIFTVCYLTQCFSVAQNNAVFQLGTTGTAYLNIAPDARAGGMGHSGTATEANANSIHWNPSKMVFSDQKGAVSLSHSPWLRGLVDDVNLSTLSSYKKVGTRHAIGGSVKQFRLGSLCWGWSTINAEPQYSPTTETELAASYAYKATGNFSFGGSVKLLSARMKDQCRRELPSYSVSALAADLSVSYVNSNISTGRFKSSFASGLVLSHIGNEIPYGAEDMPTAIPTHLRFGNVYSIQFNEKHNLSATANLNKLLVLDANIQTVINHLKSIAIGGGVEYSYRDFIALRSGYFSQNVMFGNRAFLTAGIGLNVRSFALDVSYLISTRKKNPLTNTMQFSLNYSFAKS